jgi:hypothetical protein
MPAALIKIAYRQIINAASQNAFEKNILNYSYNEFLLKSQVYNLEGKFKTFTELKANDGRANSLHYKSGFAVGGLIDRLNKKIPFLQDTLGQPVVFDTYKFEVIESDITNRLLHKVSITYITGVLTLFAAIGECLVLAAGDQLTATITEPVDSFSLKMQVNLSIVSYQPAGTEKNILA